MPIINAKVGGGGGSGVFIQDADADTIVNTEEAADEDKVRIDTGGTERALFSGTCAETYVKINKHSDLDGDTFIQVEESADDDTIRMDVAGVEAFKLNTSGILTLAKQSMVHAYQNVSAIIPTGTWVQMRFDTEVYDIQNEFDSTVKTGTARATTANHLIDNVANQFVAGDLNAWIWNTTDNTYAQITAVNSVSDVTISANIMTIGEGYTLYRSWYTPSVSGVYFVLASTQLNGNSVDAKQVAINILVSDGSGIGSAGSNSSAALQFCWSTASGISYLTAGVRVYSYMYHDMGSAKLLQGGGADRIRFQVFKLS